MLRRMSVVRGVTVLGLGAIVGIVAAPTVASASAETRARAEMPRVPFPGALAKSDRVGANGQTPVTTSSCGKAVYMGGPVISNVQVVVVFWSSSVDSVVTGNMPGFFSALTQSEFLDMLSEYSTTGQSGGTSQTVGRGALVTAKTITPMVATGSTIQDSQIGSELEAQIAAGVLPAPVMDAHGYSNTLYFNFFAPGMTVNDQGDDSCTTWCGYHSSYTSGGKPIPYAVIPDMSSSSECRSGCGVGTEVNFIESTSAHELSEAITDMDVGGNDVAWYINGNSCGEIGDVCDTPANDSGNVDGYTVQLVWSNDLNKCADNNPAVTLTGCTTNSTCTSPTGICNTTTGTCVECGSSSDCSASAPVCNTSAGTCGPCTSSSQCTNASDPVCTNGTCGPSTSTGGQDAGTSGGADASTGGGADSGTGGGHLDASTGGGSDSGGGYGDDSGSGGDDSGSGNGSDGGSGSSGNGWNDDTTASSGGCSMYGGANDVSYGGLGIACVAGAMLASRSRRSKRR
jgi:hypothetical protein